MVPCLVTLTDLTSKCVMRFVSDSWVSCSVCLEWWNGPTFSLHDSLEFFDYGHTISLEICSLGLYLKTKVLVLQKWSQVILSLLESTSKSIRCFKVVEVVIWILHHRKDTHTHAYLLEWQATVVATNAVILYYACQSCLYCVLNDCTYQKFYSQPGKAITVVPHTAYNYCEIIMGKGPVTYVDDKFIIFGLKMLNNTPV